MASYKLKLQALPFDTQVFNYHLDSDFLNSIEKTDVQSGSVGVTVRVTRKSERTFVLEIDCRGQLTMPCDRCLEDVTLDVCADYRLTLRHEGEHLDDSVDGVLLVPEAWSEFDLAEVMRDTVLLAIPMVHSHAEGDCDPAMTRRIGLPGGDLPDNDEGGEPLDPRWEALRKLQENN